jgi:hypothetical protein
MICRSRTIGRIRRACGSSSCWPTSKAPPSRAGSYLFEPPGSTHTLKVADHAREETDVVFVVYGAMIHLGPRGEVLAIGDAESH